MDAAQELVQRHGLEQGVGVYVDQVYNSRPAVATTDFIDIEHRGKRDQVVEALREAVIVDPAIDWVGNMSRLGLVELKRRRGGPTLAEMWSRRDA